MPQAKEIILKPITKVVIVILAVAAVAAGIIFAQLRLGRSESFASLSAVDLTAIVSTLDPQVQRTLAQNAAQRKELINNLKQLFALASAAQAEGLDRTDKFKRQMAISTDQLLAGEAGKQDPQASVPKEESDAYLKAHAKEFEEDLNVIVGGEQGPTPEQVETLKTQWAEMKIMAEKARQAGLDKDPKIPLQLKLQRAQTLARLYARSMQEKLKPSPEELKKHYEENPGSNLEELKQKAEGLRARINQGEDFAALAKEHSDDKASGEKGGELGWGSKGTWVEEFEAAAFALQPGQTSELVKSGFGFHIIQVLERRTVEKKADEAKKDPAAPAPAPTPEDKGPQEEVKARHILVSTRDADGVEQMLTQKKMERAFQDATLKYPVSVPDDFVVNAPGVRPPGLQLPSRGGGQGGHMAPIIPNEKK
jgi:hypothetical protein